MNMIQRLEFWQVLYTPDTSEHRISFMSNRGKPGVDSSYIIFCLSPPGVSGATFHPMVPHGGSRGSILFCTKGVYHVRTCQKDLRRHERA